MKNGIEEYDFIEWDLFILLEEGVECSLILLVSVLGI